MDARECRVIIYKMRQVMGCGMGTRKLGRFLAWINGWRKVVKLKVEAGKEHIVEEVFTLHVRMDQGEGRCETR